VSFNDFFAQRETDSRTGIFLLGMQTLKNNEDPLGVLRVDANAVIAKREQPFNRASALLQG